MKNILRLEEAATFILSIYLLSLLEIHLNWWVYILLYLAPDIGMIGYIFNNKAGAVLYNLFHHKAIASVVVLMGLVSQNQYMLLASVILFGHAAMDRIFGYGLKYFKGFKHTHLGVMK